MGTGTPASSYEFPAWPKNPIMKEYVGGCHCRRFQYKFTHPVFENGGMDVVCCNCSLCQGQGKLYV
jgi:hypothetical protein